MITKKYSQKELDQMIKEGRCFASFGVITSRRVKYRIYLTSLHNGRTRVSYSVDMPFAEEYELIRLFDSVHKIKMCIQCDVSYRRVFGDYEG